MKVLPNESNMLFIRPKNCRYCGNGFYALGHAKNYAQSKGFSVIDIAEKNANKEPVYNAITQYDPASVYGFGHGLDCRYTGDSEEDIYNCYECSNLNGRIVYLLSCLTANGLGLEIIRNGAVAYAGFNISWTWIAQGETDTDPYTDKYAKCFYESANALWVSLCDGDDFHTAVQRSIDKYNEWIDYWFNVAPQDPYSQECIKWLAFDRDGLVSMDVCDAITDEQECLNLNCYWYNNMCHSSLPCAEESNISIAVPVLAIVGIILVASLISK